MTTQIFNVGPLSEGQLYIMPHPPSKGLENHMAHFKSLDINVIVSHLKPFEVENLGLTQESTLAQSHDIEFISYPIPDHRRPNRAEFLPFINQLYDRLLSGQNMAIHCRAGIGRTGVTASCLLIKNGLSPQEAMCQVSSARGIRIPETKEQFDFIHQFAELIKS